MRAQPPGTDNDYNQIIVQALEQYKRGDLNDSEYRRVLSEVSQKLSMTSVSGQKILSHSFFFLIKIDRAELLTVFNSLLIIANRK